MGPDGYYLPLSVGLALPPESAPLGLALDPSTGDGIGHLLLMFTLLILIQWLVLTLFLVYLVML